MMAPLIVFAVVCALLALGLAVDARCRFERLEQRIDWLQRQLINDGPTDDPDGGEEAPVVTSLRLVA